MQETWFHSSLRRYSTSVEKTAESCLSVMHARGVPTEGYGSDRQRAAFDCLDAPPVLIGARNWIHACS